MYICIYIYIYVTCVMCPISLELPVKTDVTCGDVFCDVCCFF